VTEQQPTEYVVWGIVGDDLDHQVLFSLDPRTGDPITDVQVAHALEQVAIRRGATNTRIQSIDFDGTINFG
jgi:hypothetical protein